MTALPARQREVVLLRDVEGLSSAEVCEVLAISEANQRVLLHRGRSKLRQLLESELGGWAAMSFLSGLLRFRPRPRDLPCQQVVELVTDYLEGALPPARPPPARGAPRRLPALHRVPGPDARDDPAGRPGHPGRPDARQMRTDLTDLYRRWRAEG